MIAKAKLRYLRASPTKLNGLARLIRGRSLDYSLGLLGNLSRPASKIFLKVVKSALSNAQNKGLDTSDLNKIYISKLIVNPGPVLKRYKASAFGRAVMIRRRTSHIEIELKM